MPNAKRLLQEVRRTAIALDDAKVERNAAIIAAMDAGLPRDDIAAAARLARSRLYQVIRESLPPPAPSV